MVEGVTVLLTMLVAINGALNVVWDTGLKRWLWTSMLLYFITPALLGSYICRALRLAVVFHPRAKKAVPWLIPERNYLRVLLVGSVAMLAVPIYYDYNYEIWEIIPKQIDILAWISIAFAVILACIYPFIRKVDDLFNISKELALVTVAIILLALAQKLVTDYGGVYEQRWIGENIWLLFAATVFGVSVVDPLRRLAFDPLAATKRNYMDRVLLARSQGRSTVRTASGKSSGRGGDSEVESALDQGGPTSASAAYGNGDILTSGGAASSDPAGARDGNRRAAAHGGERERGGGGERAGGAGAAGGGGGGGSGQRMEVWNFERLATTPLLAAAFEDFSRKALCHESVLFLIEVSRYKDDDFASSTAQPPSQFGAFCYITDTFIKAGSREEVNISDADKRRICDLYHKGRGSFEKLDDDERRLVFMEAYVEVRQMLEANLLRRFLNTEQFRRLRTQRENIQAMMDSPQQEVATAV
eukprot:g2955.t1